ncbi:MAG TPA: hypothetical protein VL856_10935 [Acidimicrobiia bacterium]|jgi:hypothetical protein|nr:hypothetical protein [Acidimicrobiia bacterium]
MEKLMYLVWDAPTRPAPSVDELGARLLALEPRALQIDLDDADADVASMVPIPDDELPVRACISIWLDALDRRGPYEDVVRELGVRQAGYLVTESLYCDYGGNAHASPRDWPDGTRSPGIITLTMFDAPAGVSDDAFYGHWYGHQSPMSEAMQPRARYVRNAVVRAITPGAPRFRAIVEEAWPSVEHLTNLHTFFGAATNEDLGENVRIMLDSTKLLYNPATMRNYTMSEYILKS